MNNKILNVVELAELLQCSVSCVRKLVKNGQVPYFRVGAKIHFSQNSIETWIKLQEQESIDNEDNCQMRHLEYQKLN